MRAHHLDRWSLSFGAQLVIAWAVLMGTHALSCMAGAVAVLPGGIAGPLALQLTSVLTVSVALAMLLSRAVREYVN
jgi:membrane protein implicated in regulation of membrane protease activity